MALTKSPVCTRRLSISYTSAAHIPSKSHLEAKQWSTKCPLTTELQKESRTQEKQLSTLPPGGDRECCWDHHPQHLIKSLVQSGLWVGVVPSLGQSRAKLWNKENTKIDLIIGFFFLSRLKMLTLIKCAQPCLVLLIADFLLDLKLEDLKHQVQ